MRDREYFPTLDEQIGEDPARFLDVDFLDHPAAWDLARARIRGIRLVEVVRAWKAVERNLGRGSDGGPRSRVIEMLERREENLQEHEFGDVRIEALPESEHQRPAKPNWVWVYDGDRSTERKTGASTRIAALRADGGGQQ